MSDVLSARAWRAGTALSILVAAAAAPLFMMSSYAAAIAARLAALEERNARIESIEARRQEARARIEAGLAGRRFSGTFGAPDGARSEARAALASACAALDEAACPVESRPLTAAHSEFAARAIATGDAQALAEQLAGALAGPVSAASIEIVSVGDGRARVSAAFRTIGAAARAESDNVEETSDED